MAKAKGVELSRCEICGITSECQIDFLGLNTCDYCFIINSQKFDDYWKAFEKNNSN